MTVSTAFMIGKDTPRKTCKKSYRNTRCEDILLNSLMNTDGKKGLVLPKQRDELFGVLKTRFGTHMNRHRDLVWKDVQTKLEETSGGKLWSLYEMERTGGEPDVVGVDPKSGDYIFTDCSMESPKGRRSLCYDHESLESRIEAKPKNSAMDMCASMGIELLTEEEYRWLQTLESFDTKTSSWVKTPSDVRKLGGALYGDRRYDRVFIYHNGAESYYASRGFRGSLRV